MPHEWTMSLSENTAEWVAFFGFAALAIFVICWAICKDLKKIDEETERKIKGLPPKRRKRRGRRDEDVESGGDDGFEHVLDLVENASRALLKEVSRAG